MGRYHSLIAIDSDIDEDFMALGLGAYLGTGGRFNFYTSAIIGWGRFKGSNYDSIESERIDYKDHILHYNLSVGLDIWPSKNWGINVQVGLSPMQLLSVGGIIPL